MDRRRAAQVPAPNGRRSPAWRPKGAALAFPPSHVLRLPASCAPCRKDALLGRSMTGIPSVCALRWGLGSPRKTTGTPMGPADPGEASPPSGEQDGSPSPPVQNWHQPASRVSAVGLTHACTHTHTHIHTHIPNGCHLKTRLHQGSGQGQVSP